MNNINRYFFNKEINLERNIEIIKKVITSLALDLSNLVIFTETASGQFLFTQIIAAFAGAKKVYSIVRNSKYASEDEVLYDTKILIDYLQLKDIIEIVNNKNNINQADIITNLGFVRPIDKMTIDMLKKEAVIPYMAEAWEFRKEDLDIDYCRKKGILVMGTNENYLNTFNFVGELAIKLIHNLNIEIFKSKIIIISSDNFGKVIYKTLKLIANEVFLIDNNNNLELFKNADIIIVADYISNEVIIGDGNAKISANILKEYAPYSIIIQFSGKIDINYLNKLDILYYPSYCVGNYRMVKTLAYLGAKPLIELHAAGLKVGEIMYKEKNNSVLSGKLSIEELELQIEEKYSLCQRIKIN